MAKKPNPLDFEVYDYSSCGGEMNGWTGTVPELVRQTLIFLVKNKLSDSSLPPAEAKRGKMLLAELEASWADNSTWKDPEEE